jgi:hypothetical protein
MSKERKILKKILMLYREDKSCMDWRTANEIQVLLDKPEQEETQYLLDQVSRLFAENAMLKEKWSIPKREPLSDEEVIAKYRTIAVDNALYVPTYYAGFRDAEKMHGIGGGA